MTDTMTDTKTEPTPSTPEAKPAPVAGTPPASEPTTPAPVPAAPVAEKVEKPSGTDAAPNPEFFFKQRDAKREKKAQERVVELEKELQALRQTNIEKAAQQPEPEPEPVFSLDDPEGSFKKMEARAAQRAIEEVKREQQAQQRYVEYIQATDKARELLLTRSHLKEDPKAKDEIAAILESKYERLALLEGGADPMNAARLAYMDWCQQKGVVPDFDGLPRAAMQMTAGRTSSGVPPTAPGTGKRQFAKGEVKKYLNEVPAGTPEWQRRLDETDEAYREGRVQR